MKKTLEKEAEGLIASLLKPCSKILTDMFNPYEIQEEEQCNKNNKTMESLLEAVDNNKNEINEQYKKIKKLYNQATPNKQSKKISEEVYQKIVNKYYKILQKYSIELINSNVESEIIKAEEINIKLEEIIQVVETFLSVELSQTQKDLPLKNKSLIYKKLAEISDIKGDSAETTLKYAEQSIEILDNPDARKYKAIALNKQGNRLFKLEDYQLAIDKYNKAIENEPNRADSHFYKSTAQYALNDHEAAIKTIKYALTIDSNNDQYKALEVLIINEQVHTLCSKGEQNYQNAQYEASLDNYKKASEYIQNNDDCAFGVLRAEAYLLLSRDKYVEAKDFFVQALELNQADHRCNVEIVKLLILFAEFEEAKEYLSNINTINTDEFKDLKSKIKNGLDQDTVNSSIDQLLARVPSIYLNDLSENTNNDQNESEVASLGGITIVDSAEFT
jgi:tetratricopeptide (TPR) repeat protein